MMFCHLRMFKIPMINALRRREGTALIEFALTVPVLLTLMLGIIEFGRVLWAQNALHYAVEEAARCMTFNATSCGSTSATQNYAAATSGMTFANASAVFTPTTAVACGAVTGNKVTASYPFPFLTTFFSYSITLTAQACFPTG
jgi:Flp pilus assembly protein TadG